MTEGLYRYIWRVSGRDQVFLSLVAAAVFLLDLVPLELQRRIVNGALEKHALMQLVLLSLLYVATVLAQGGLKFLLNVYRGSVSEAANRRLRQQLSPSAANGRVTVPDTRRESIDTTSAT